MASATFTGPNGSDPRAAIHAVVEALSVVTAGDLLHIGEIFISRIRQRTFAGIDVDGAPFAAYSTRGPFYLYVNRDAASGRTSAGRAARATASKNRHAKTGRIGIRTATGIRYESYAAAKAAHGVANVNLYGLEQHPHMLDLLKVRTGGFEGDVNSAEFNGNANTDVNVFQGNQPASSLQLGFWGDEAGRAKGHNEGTSKLPKRRFLGLNQTDMQLGEQLIARRMILRARAGGTSGSSPVQSIAPSVSGPITLDDVGF